MSAIASFIKLPTSTLDGLRVAAIPRKRLFGGVRDDFDAFLQQNGEEASSYEWSGYVLATLLVYLKSKQQIDLMSSEFDELSKSLAKSRGATHFIFTYAHRQKFLDKFDTEFSEKDLCDYYNEFNGASESGAGQPMVDGLRAIQESLGRLDEQSVILLSIG